MSTKNKQTKYNLATTSSTLAEILGGNVTTQIHISET